MVPLQTHGRYNFRHDMRRQHRPWFPYRHTGAIIRATRAQSPVSPWFPYRHTGAIIAGLEQRLMRRPWFPYRHTGAIIR